MVLAFKTLFLLFLMRVCLCICIWRAHSCITGEARWGIRVSWNWSFWWSWAAIKEPNAGPHKLTKCQAISLHTVSNSMVSLQKVFKYRICMRSKSISRSHGNFPAKILKLEVLHYFTLKTFAKNKMNGENLNSGGSQWRGPNIQLDLLNWTSGYSSVTGS